jgi:hypothetical protein
LTFSVQLVSGFIIFVALFSQQMPRTRIKLVNEETVTDTDRLTGEVREVVTRKRYSIPVRTDEFFMTFIQFMGPFYEIRYADDFKVLAKMCSWAQMNTGEVDLTALKRKKMMEDLVMTKEQISRSLRRLKGLDLIRGEGGSYCVSHEIFWKGGTDERAAMGKKKLEAKSVLVSFEQTRDNDIDDFENQKP